MVSAFDKTFKLGVLLSFIDWFTFNVVFLLYSLYIGLNTSNEFFVDILISNIAYFIALQIVTISLHPQTGSAGKGA